MKTLITTLSVAVALSTQAAETNKFKHPITGKPQTFLEHYAYTNRLAKQARTNAQADATAKKISKEYRDTFGEGEIQIEVSGQARTRDFDTYGRSLTLGGNYYLTQSAGFHAAVGLTDLNDQFIDRVEFGLLGRVPVQKLKCALLFGIGAEWQKVSTITGGDGNPKNKKPKKPKPGDDDCDDPTEPPKEPDPPTTPGGKDPQDELDRLTRNRSNEWAIYAEAGPVFRMNKYLDVFLKVRGVRPVDSADGEHLAVIAGSALTF